MSLRRVNYRSSWFLLLSLAVSCMGETLTGTLYSQHSGATGNASVTVKIASEGGIFQMQAAERLLKDFKSGLCRDIGAIWTVEFTRQQNSHLVLTKAVCDGEVDAIVHDAWLVVTNHLRNRAPQLRPTLEAISSRWRTSEAFSSYEVRVRDVKFSDYARLSSMGRCLDVRTVDSLRIELATTADCHLRYNNSPLDLSFSIATNRSASVPEIDEIRFMDHAKH